MAEYNSCKIIHNGDIINLQGGGGGGGGTVVCCMTIGSGTASNFSWPSNATYVTMKETYCGETRGTYHCDFIKSTGGVSQRSYFRGCPYSVTYGSGTFYAGAPAYGDMVLYFS